MTEIDIVLLLDESKKHTEYLRRIRNWAAFAGIMLIIMLIIIPILLWTLIEIGVFSFLFSL